MGEYFWEAGLDYGGLILLVALILFGPPLLFFVLAMVYWNRKKKLARIFLIGVGVYLLIGLGVCTQMFY